MAIDTDSKPSGEPPSIATLTGAEVLASSLHDASKVTLTEILRAQPAVELPDFSKLLQHDTYLQIRERLARSSTLAALVGSPLLDDYIGQWVDLQHGYAQLVIKEVNNQVQDQRGMLQIAEKDLQEGKSLLTEFDRLTAQGAEHLTEKDMGRLEEILPRVRQLKNTQKAYEQLQRAVAGVSHVEQSLTTLIESGVNCIHYIIPSAKEAQDRLGDNTYDGPDFQPFVISARSKVQDMYGRHAPMPSVRPGSGTKGREINTSDLPPQLHELARLYEYVIQRPPETIIDPSYVKREQGLELGGRGIASYLQDNGKVFGVKPAKAKGGARMFVREGSVRALDTNMFLLYMKDRLQQQDSVAVNAFYLERALALMRERPEAYSGFTRNNLTALVENHGMLVGSKSISRNLNNYPHKWKVVVKKKAKGTDPGLYVFAEVVPTETQIGYVHSAVDELGLSTFDAEAVRGKVHEMHANYRIVTTVVTQALHDHYASWGLHVVSETPLRYRKQENRPESDRREDHGQAGRLV